MSFGIAAAIIGGGLGLMSSMNQADAVSQAGQDTRDASVAATNAQVGMFNAQQQAAINRYNATQQGVSRLFGGNITWGDAPNSMAEGNLFGANMGYNNPQLQALIDQIQKSGTGVMNSGATMNPLVGQFGDTASSQLQQFNSFNPQTMSQDIYSKLSMLGQPQRVQDRANLESRLLNQGILTSSPGFSQINSMDQANGQQDLAREIQSMLTAQSTQQQMLANAQGAAGSMSGLLGAQGNLATQGAGMITQGENMKNASYGPALQALGISAGVPVNSAQPIPTGQLSVAGAQAQGQANMNAANITNSFWSSLGNNSGFQQGLAGLLGNLGGGGGSLPSGGGSPINTSGLNLNGADGLFALLNGYGGGV